MYVEIEAWVYYWMGSTQATRPILTSLNSTKTCALHVLDLLHTLFISKGIRNDLAYDHDRVSEAAWMEGAV